MAGGYELVMRLKRLTDIEQLSDIANYRMSTTNHRNPRGTLMT